MKPAPFKEASRQRDLVAYKALGLVSSLVRDKSLPEYAAGIGAEIMAEADKYDAELRAAATGEAA